jgi:hypothetical protein
VNVDEMLEQISYPQFLEWYAFSELEPFDEVRADLRTAQITAAIYNVNRDKKKRSRPYTLHEVSLKFGDEPEPEPVKQTWKQQKMLAQLYCGMFNSDQPRG